MPLRHPIWLAARVRYAYILPGYAAQAAMRRDSGTMATLTYLTDNSWKNDDYVNYGRSL